MLTDDELKAIEDRCNLDESEQPSCTNDMRALIAEVKKLRARPQFRVAKFDDMSEPDQVALRNALTRLGSDAMVIPSSVEIVAIEGHDFARFRAFFDSFGIDYHIENHYGPNGSPIEGAACSIELGSSIEFAFDAEGRFLGWVEFDEMGVRSEVHLRGAK